MDTDRTDPIAEELASLRARLELAERRIAELDGHGAGRRAEPGETDAPRSTATAVEPVALAEPSESTTDRRGALRTAGLAAGAAVAGLGAVVATASPAAAADGDALTLGVTTNVASSPTRAKNLLTSGDHLFQFSDSNNTASTSSGIATLAARGGGIPIALLAESTQIGIRAASSGISQTAIQCETSGDNSVALRATGIRSSVQTFMAPGVGTGVEVIGGLRGVVAGSSTTYPLALRAVSGSSAVGPPASAAVAGDFFVDSTNATYVCVTSGTPGTWRQLSGPTAAGAVTPITPTRVYDSRRGSGTGPLAGGQNRAVSVADGIDVTTGAVTTLDVVPAGATAIQYNLTIVNTVATGYLQVAPGDASAITSSSINWTASGQIVANGLMVKLDANRLVRAFASGGSTDFVIDVLGYYR